MRNILVCIVLALLYGNVWAGAIKDCHVGADPWRSGRQADTVNAKEYRLNEPILLESLNSKGKPSGVCRLTAGESTIVIPNGFDTSVDHPGLPVDQLAWIKGCGNPIVSKFKLTIAPATLPFAQTAAPIPPPVVAPPPPVVSMEGRECRYGERMGTYLFVDRQMVCLIQEVVRVQPAPQLQYEEYEEYEEEVEYVQAPPDRSWVPWVVGGVIAGAAWWRHHRGNGSAAPFGQAPVGLTNGLVNTGHLPIGTTDGLVNVGQAPVGLTNALVGGQVPSGLTNSFTTGGQAPLGGSGAVSFGQPVQGFVGW